MSGQSNSNILFSSYWLILLHGVLWIGSQLPDTHSDITTGNCREVHLCAILEHHSIAECAVIAVEDDIKGSVPVALCVLVDEHERVQSLSSMKAEIINIVRNEVGPVAALKKVIFVPKLPKTRSGKIARSTLASMANNKPYKIPVTIEDESVYPVIQQILINEGLIKDR